MKTPLFTCDGGCDICYPAEDLCTWNNDLYCQECWDHTTIDSSNPHEWNELERFQYQPPLPKFLERMAGRLNSQDNRITADPLFCVFEKQEIVVPEEMCHDKIEWWNSDEGFAADEQTKSLLNEQRDDVDSDFYLDDEIEFDGSTWRRQAIQLIDKFVTAALTEKGAQDHIDQNGHNLRAPFIYATSLYRTPEMIELRNWIKAIQEQAS